VSILGRVKLGALAKRVDPRTIQYRAMASPWNPPPSWDWDLEQGNPCPARMYLNDQLGCCVISARANATTRLEYQEQGTLITIPDADVSSEYYHESGGVDSGLYPIESMNAWRRGWMAANRFYNIHAWMNVSPQDRQQVAEAAIVGQGLQAGMRLPISAADQIDAGKPWDLVSGPRGEAGSWGGHMTYLSGYDADGVTMWTWAKRQRATWRWVAEYVDFLAIAVDDVNAPRASVLDAPRLAGAVEEATR
jgi:YD repeat-containing protein